MSKGILVNFIGFFSTTKGISGFPFTKGRVARPATTRLQWDHNFLIRRFNLLIERGEQISAGRCHKVGMFGL